MHTVIDVHPDQYTLFYHFEFEGQVYGGCELVYKALFTPFQAFVRASEWEQRSLQAVKDKHQTPLVTQQAIKPRQLKDVQEENKRKILAKRKI